uniref:Uncharacterized protein n=1 Tax=Hucho hucho TaxID=62062 RepID=A0A4W5KXE4_9TELE
MQSRLSFRFVQDILDFRVFFLGKIFLSSLPSGKTERGSYSYGRDSNLHGCHQLL